MSGNKESMKTSIVPAGGRIEPLREHETTLTTIQIDIVHIAIFLSVIFIFFAKPWKEASKK